MDQLLSLDTTPVDPGISLDTTAAPVVNDTAAQSRSAKADVGLSGVTGQNYDDVYRQISGGQEDTFRGGAASLIDYKGQEDRQKTLSTLAVQHGRNLSLGEVNSILENKPTDPNTVIEKAYADKYIASLKDAAQRIDDNILTEAQTNDPEAVDHFFNQGSDILSRREYAISGAQNLQTTVDNDAYFHIPFPEAVGGPIAIGSKNAPWWSGLNWATLGVTGGLREEYLMRGGVGIPTALQANVIAQESKDLLRLPTFDAFQTAFDKRYNALKSEDPSLAQQWAMAIAGQSTDEMITRDFMSATNIVGAAGAFKTIKGLLGGLGKSQAENLGRSIPPSSGGAAVQQAQKAVEDVLRTSPAAPTKINIAEATGDSKEAAVQKAVVSAAQPDPIRDGQDTLLDLHRTNQDAIRNAPGNNSREEHTRILDAGETFDKNTVDAIKETTKIVRLPALAEEGFRDVADRANQYFRGSENTIVNIDMQHDPISNTEWHVYTLGNYNSEPFTSRLQAQNHADIKGYGKASTVGTDPDIVYLPKAAVLENKHYESFENAKGVEHTPNENTHYVTPEEQKAFQSSRQVTGARLDKGKLHLITDHENGAFITARKEPAHGLVPVEYSGKSSPKFGDELVASKSGSRIEPRSNFSFEKDKEGSWSFHLDDEHGTRAEIMPAVNPNGPVIPFNLKTGKFLPELGVGPHIIQSGLGFHLKWFIPLNEQDNWLRENHLITSPRTKSSSSERSLINGSFLGYFRLPQDTLSAAENENRWKLVYSENKYMNLIKNEMRYVEDIFHGRLKGGLTDAVVGDATGRNKQVWNEFKRALVVSQKLPDPETGLPGYYMKTPAEIQHFWNTAFDRPPSMAEQQAYLAVGRMDYADWVFRNIAVFKNKARLAVMEHTLESSPIRSNSGEPVISPPFEGRLISKIPEGNTPVAIHNSDGTFEFYNSKNTKDKQAFKEEFNRGGYRGVQLYNPDQYPIKVFDKDNNPVRVVYVLSKNMDSSPITYKQVGYRGGGHWDYNYDNYIKQPIMRKYTVGGKTHWVYEGDATFAPIKNAADGKVFISKLNEIRTLLSQKKIAEAKAVHLSYSDMPWKDFIKHFYIRKDRTTGELTPARFNTWEDFRVVPKGFTIAEYDKKLIKKYEAMTGKFVNAANGEQSLARNFQVEFTGARDSHDLFEPQNVGTIGNPMYKFQPAELTDPITTLVRSARRIMTSMAGDDYKYSAVEHWLQENMDMLNARPEEVRGSPFHYFMNGELNRRFRNSLQGQAAESNRYKIKKLVGMPTYMDSQIHMYKQALSDMMYETDSKTKKALLVVPSWTLAHVNSPTNFVRGMAFHENLGFWNWSQLAAQNMGFINVIAQSPDHAMAGVFGAWMHAWSTVNAKPGILKGLGRLTEKLPNGWKPGEWEAARDAYQKTGFGQIGNTMSFHDTQKNFLTSGATNMLRKGTVFFDLAEQAVRHGSWYTAFHEYSRAFPNSKIDDVAIGKIGARANDLYANMGRDSKTMLNTGVTSMTLQFFKYIENVGQLFFSKRIGNVFGQENNWKTRATQRAQMIAMYSLMFGPLGATGLTLLPINDWVRKQAIAGGYVPGSHAWSSLLMEGPMSVAGAYASGWWRSGHFDMSKGTFYNFNDRYGANGYQFIRDLLESSPILWKVLLGASGTTLANNLASLSPFVYAIKSAYNDESDNPFKITFDDWKQGLENINSMRYADRLVYALEYSKWKDRHGANITDVGAGDAILRTLLGTNDQKIDDQYIKNQIREQETSDYHKASQDYQHYRRLAEQAAINGDNDQAIAYNKNAIFALKSRGVPPEEASKIFAQDANLNKNTLDKTNDSFYHKLVPTYRQPSANEAYQDTYRK